MTLTQFTLINCYLVFFWGLYLLLVRGARHTTFNRWYLLLTPIISILLVFLPTTGTLTITEPFVTELAQVNIFLNRATDTTRNEFSWGLLCYLSGILLSLLLLIVNLYKVLKSPKGTFLNRSEGIDIYLISSERTSFSFFNRIYLNENQLANYEIILLHERAHCSGLHSLDILILAIYRAFFWFNPIIYLMDRAAKENHEFIADQSVLKQSIGVQEYSYSLLSVTFNCAVPELGNGFNAKSLLLKRIQHLKFKNQITMKHVIIVPAVLAAFVISATNLSTAQTTPSNSTAKKIAYTQDENLVQAEFIGGQEAMMTYLMDNLVYPKTKMTPEEKSMVYVAFTVTEKGEIQNVEIAKASEHDEFNTEATRVISQMPNWKPATKDGMPVASKMTLPILFRAN